jgi:hypothetical protein
VRQQLELVEADCRPGAYKGNDAVRRDFETFFVECIRLGDWLWQDKSTGLTKDAVRKHIRSNRDLKICSAAAIIKKHHTRDDPSAMTARVSSVSWDPNGVRVSIDWSQGSTSGTEDALGLATR